MKRPNFLVALSMLSQRIDTKKADEPLVQQEFVAKAVGFSSFGFSGHVAYLKVVSAFRAFDQFLGVCHGGSLVNLSDCGPQFFGN